MIKQLTNERETALRIANKLFSEINFILRLCGLCQDALFFKALMSGFRYEFLRHCVAGCHLKQLLGFLLSSGLFCL
jgi:hypothetical protein